MYQPDKLQGAYSNIFLFVGLVSLSVFLSFYPSISIALPSHLGCRLLLRNEASVCVRYAFFLLFQVSVTSSRLFQWGMSKKINLFHPPQLHFTLSPDLFLLFCILPSVAGFSLNIHQEGSLSVLGLHDCTTCWLS